MEGAPRFAHDLVEGRMALRDRGHPVLQMTRHLRTREVRPVDREGIDEGPTCGGRPHRAAAHELSTEQGGEDLVPGRLRAEFEPLHRQQEGALRGWGRRVGTLLHDQPVLDGYDTAL